MEKPRYSIEKKLKEGGYGTIYLGFDSELNIPIVIKKIHVEGMDPEKQYRVAYDDALIASRLRGHPNIVDVYGFNKTATGKYIIIMEYINGYNFIELPEKLKQLNIHLPLDFSLYMVSQICEGLEYAHTRMDKQGNYLNIIHRDISPSNNMVSFDGFIKIIDFGIAKGRIRKQSQTGEGVIKGKLAYMAPEQLKGIPYDHRADVYATGVILFELVTGERLFQESDSISAWNLIQDVANQNVDLPAFFNRHNISDNIRSIIYKAITINPQDRYQSAGDMQSDIISALSNKSETELRQKLAKFLKEIDRASQKLEEKKESNEDTPVSTIEIKGDIIEEEKDASLKAQELSDLSNIITPTKTLLPQYDKLRFEYNLHRLQEKIDERNRFVIQSRRADPVSGFRKIEQWTAHNKLTPFVKLNLEGKEIKLTILWDKLQKSDKHGIESDKISTAVRQELESLSVNSIEGSIVDQGDVHKEKEELKTRGITIEPPSHKSSKKLFFGVGLLLIIVLLGVIFTLRGLYKPITISSYPQGAQVVIDNEVYGVTPVSFSPTQKMSEVSLKLSGFSNISTEVNLRNVKKEDRNIYFAFNKLVKIKASSEKAQIFINKDRIGYSEGILLKDWKVDKPLEIQTFLEGFDPLDITLIYTENGTFRVLPEETPWLDVEVEPETKDLSLVFKFGKWVEFVSDPPEATFKDIEGNLRYANSNTMVWYPVGRHIVVFSEKDYEPKYYSINIGPDFKNPQKVQFKKKPVSVRLEDEIPRDSSDKLEIIKPPDTRKTITVKVLTGIGEPIPGMEAIIKHNGKEQSFKTNSSGFTYFKVDANPGDRIEVTFNPAKGFTPVSPKRFEIIEGKNEYLVPLPAHSGDNKVKLNQGEELIKNKKNDDAILTFSEVERGSTPQEFSEYLEAQYYIAYIHQSNQRWDKAINQYLQVVELKPNYALAYYSLAMCHYKKGDYRNASENFNNVLTYGKTIPYNQRESILIKSRYFDAKGRTIFIRENLLQMSQELKARRIKDTIRKWNEFLDFPPENDANKEEFERLKRDADESIEFLKSL